MQGMNFALQSTITMPCFHQTLVAGVLSVPSGPMTSISIVPLQLPQIYTWGHDYLRAGFGPGVDHPVGHMSSNYNLLSPQLHPWKPPIVAGPLFEN